jgi:hypothetical protein
MRAVSRLRAIWLLIAAVVPCACASGGDSSGNPATYISTWTYFDALTTSTCPAGDVVTGHSTWGGQLIVTANPAGGLLVTDHDGCMGSFSIDGSTASASPSGQSCTDSTGQMLQIDSWSLYVYNSDTLWPRRTVTRTGSNGAPCQVSIVATAGD